MGSSQLHGYFLSDTFLVFRAPHDSDPKECGSSLPRASLVIHKQSKCTQRLVCSTGGNELGLSTAFLFAADRFDAKGVGLKWRCSREFQNAKPNIAGIRSRCSVGTDVGLSVSPQQAPSFQFWTAARFKHSRNLQDRLWLRLGGAWIMF